VGSTTQNPTSLWAQTSSNTIADKDGKFQRILYIKGYNGHVQQVYLHQASACAPHLYFFLDTLIAPTTEGGVQETSDMVSNLDIAVHFENGKISTCARALW
jgi:hypothetical protein